MDPSLLAAAVRRADTFEFAIAVIIAVAALIAGLWGWLAQLHRSRLIEDTPTSRIRSASQGYVELTGVGRLLPGEPITAPLSGLPCTWWSYRIEKRSESTDARGSRSRWQTIEREISDSIFVLDDGSGGQCIVDPEGAEVYPAASENWYGANPRPPTGGSRRRSWLGIGQRYRYHESRMHPGDPLFAIGYFRTHSGVAHGDLDEEMRLLLASWKRDRQRLLAQFDTNADGEIDLQEWERAREAARQQILREREHEAARPGLHVLARPDDERPFLLGALTEQGVIRRHRIRAVAGLAAFIAGAGGAAFLLLARFAMI